MHNFVLKTQQKNPLSTKFPDVKKRLQEVGIARKKINNIVPIQKSKTN
jgi:hypothetical protein